MSDEVLQAFAVLRQHLPEHLRGQEADLEAAWFGRVPRTVDWPARFRAAADAAGNRTGASHAPWVRLRKIARDLEELPQDVVEAIGRALLEEES
jgi:hypothetical protein